MYKQHLVLDEDFVPSILTEKLLDTLSMRWCGELFERTPTGLKRDTIYDYGTRTPKEVDSLEKAGYVVLRNSWSTTSSPISFYTTIYDTIDIVGLAIYLSPDDFEYGVDFKLLPTIKTVVRCRNCLTQTYLHNGFRFTSDNTLKARQLTPNGSNFIIDDILLPEWQEIDLSQYKEFLFIENPFIGNKNPFTK